MHSRHCVLHFPYKQIALKSPTPVSSLWEGQVLEKLRVSLSLQEAVFIGGLWEHLSCVISAAGPQDWVVTSILEK